MIEYYEAYADYRDVATRFEQLMAYVAAEIGYEGEIDFQKPWHRETLVGSIEKRTGIDIRATAIGNRSLQRCRRRGYRFRRPIRGRNWSTNSSPSMSSRR